eukprot:1229268-Pleurochrysis_carterae.AAC.2
MIRFKSGGYAADCRETQAPSGVFVPPHRVEWVVWVQRSDSRWASLGARPGVTRNVVYFCPSAPSAHMGKVIREAL